MTDSYTGSNKVRTIAPIAVGFFLLWVLLDRSAAWLGSYLGEWGVVVALIVIAWAIAVELGLTGSKLSLGGLKMMIRRLGLKWPSGIGLTSAVSLGAGLLLFFPIYAQLSQITLSLRPHWALLAIGLFAQGGIAEELVFRGFLFGHLSEGRSFWRAAGLATIPFLVVHLLLFATMSFPVALSATLLSLAISFPLAHLYEVSGRSIVPPAIVHFVVQGAIKLVDVGETELMPMAIAWMGVAAAAPYLLFFVRRPEAV